MNDQDKSNFVTQLEHFCVVHKQGKLTDALRNEYWGILKDLSRSEFDTAVAYLKKHSQWFPKPAAFFAARRQGWM